MAPVTTSRMTRLGKRVRLLNTDYTVVCLIPLGVELAPMRAMLDSVHDDIATKRDHNAYVLGSLGRHNVVIAALPSIGNNDSGVVANQVLNDFPSIRFGLLVGVAGGIPDIKRHDIRLGDVVVSEPTGTSGGVIQLDRGKRHPKGRFEVTGHLNKPSPLLMASVKKLKAQHLQEGNRIVPFISDMMRRYPNMQEPFGYPGRENDNLFEATYEHMAGDNCRSCDTSRTVKRKQRQEGQIDIHYGTIGSSNAVLKSAAERDRIGRKFHVFSVEMEAAGIMDTLPCLVIRGICDYADSHKNKEWQPFAAAAAAAYAKELLQTIPGIEPAESAEKNPSTPPVQIESPSLAVGASVQDEALVVELDLIRSLHFDQIDSRLRNIAEALPQTCKWLLKHDDFQAWSQRDRVQEHRGFLWIKGKPGSGKSTIMKSTFQWAKKHWSTEVVVSYFFNARAPSELEKSSLGFYRTLAHQLLSAYPHLHEPFLEEFRFKTRSGSLGDWSEHELKPFLTRSIRDLPGQPLNIFVDALDEGDENDVRQLIGFLEDLSTDSDQSDSSLRICLSSRHFPYISIKKGVSLVMEHQDGHEDDLKAYVQTKLINDGSEDMVLIQGEILKKSASIFLWVVLVIPILNRAYDTGKSVGYMTKCLATIPAELDDLFAQILQQSNEDIEECLSLFQWVLFSERALTPKELDIAVRSTLTPPRFDDEKISVERYLLNASRGLTEIVRSDKPTVQFIHETVREFLQRTGLARIDAGLAKNVRGLSHDKLKMGCFQYLILSKNFEGSIDAFRTPGSKVSSYFKSFFDYAVKNVFWHAGCAERYDIPQWEFLEHYFTDRLLRQWVRGRNTYEKRKVRKYSERVSLLYILADSGHGDLVDLLIDKKVNVNVNAAGERHGSPLQAACFMGHENIVRSLIQAGANVNTEGGEFKHALCAAIHSKHETIMDLLVQTGAKPSQDDLQTRLYSTIARGYLRGVKVLLRVGARLDYEDPRRSTPLVDAIRHKQTDIAKFLIEEGADAGVPGNSLDVRDAVLTAFDEGNFTILQLLLQNGATITKMAHYRPERREKLESQYSRSLFVACRQSEEQIVRLLIEAGADPQRLNGSSESCLHQACSFGNYRIVRLLLELGADVNVEGASKATPLHAACETRRFDIVRLLLDAGANVNACTHGGPVPHSPLQIACRAPSSGNTEIIRLLIDAGADINVGMDSDRHPLRVACLYQQVEVARCLIEAGADVHGIREYGRDVLRLVIAHGSEQTKAILLKAGALVSG